MDEAETKSRAQVEEELARSIGFTINLTSRTLRRRLRRRLGQYGLDYGSWFFLRILWIQEGFSQRELAEMADLSQPASATALNKMRQRNLIEIRPDPSDRRASHIFLTEQSRAMKGEFMELSQALHRQAVAGLTEEQVLMLRDLLRIVRRNCLEDEML